MEARRLPKSVRSAPIVLLENGVEIALSCKYRVKAIFDNGGTIVIRAWASDCRGYQNWIYGVSDTYEDEPTAVAWFDDHRYYNEIRRHIYVFNDMIELPFVDDPANGEENWD